MAASCFCRIRTAAIAVSTTVLERQLDIDFARQYRDKAEALQKDAKDRRRQAKRVQSAGGGFMDSQRGYDLQFCLSATSQHPVPVDHPDPLPQISDSTANSQFDFQDGKMHGSTGKVPEFACFNSLSWKTNDL